MAAIDKIYGTNTQYDEFYAWVQQHHPDMLPRFYPRDGYPPDDRPITNLSEEQDMWLLKNCLIGWVVARIKEQYGLDRPQGVDK